MIQRQTIKELRVKSKKKTHVKKGVKNLKEFKDVEEEEEYFCLFCSVPVTPCRRLDNVHTMSKAGP